MWQHIAAWLFAIAALAAIVLWRDPFLLIRAEFARQRRAAGLSRGCIEASGHRWIYAHRVAQAADVPASSRPTIVMLHGFTGSKENWYPLAKALRDDCRVLIPDLPGWGESERKPGAVYGFPEQAAHVAAFIAALSPGKPVLLLGHSMGGGIAALVAARYPQLVEKVGLFSAAGVRFDDNQFGLDVLAGGNPFGVRDAASLRRYIDIVFFDERAKPWVPWPASSALIARRRRDAGFEQAVLERIGRSEEAMLPGDEAARIRQPALLAWGAQDAVIDPSALGLYAQRMPQARTLLLAQCGHMSIAEKPRELADAVMALLEDH